ncbi:hypothetical protein R1flu_005628 [Riccia fluitans]|uniref:Sugar phosphate transporter domain-containing protein n=1 Tax=Riccia fluitans TaxID=41844 RepID=A0ABD1YWG7_9MARC
MGGTTDYEEKKPFLRGGASNNLLNGSDLKSKVPTSVSTIGLIVSCLCAVQLHSNRLDEGRANAGVFAYIMTLRREAWLTYVTLIPVVTGVVIASGGEPSFHLYGFIMCITATAARALKSVLQGILLSNEGEKLNSMNLLLYMAPIAVVVLLPATLYLEPNVLGIAIAQARGDPGIIFLLTINSAMAYFVNLTNFLVTKNTSALTLQVLGNAKGAVAVVVSILIFRNPVSVTGMMGYGLTVFGVVLYSEAKRRCK